VDSLLRDQGGSSRFGDSSGSTVGSSFVGGGTSALVDLVGSNASAAGGLLSVSSGAVMDLVNASAPLLASPQRRAGDREQLRRPVGRPRASGSAARLTDREQR